MLGRPEGNHEEAAAPTSSIPRRLTRSLYRKSRPHVSGVASRCSCTKCLSSYCTSRRSDACALWLSTSCRMPDSASRFYAAPYNPNRRGSECVRRTPDAFAARVQHVSTDHRRRHVFCDPAIPESDGCHSHPPADWGYGIPSDRERHRIAYL